MEKGQSSMEFLVVTGIAMLILLVTNIDFVKRGDDVTTFARDAELQGAVERVASLLSAAQSSAGLQVNTTLPIRVEGCTPSYTVYDRIVVATCGDVAYSARYAAANVTNGTSATPFVASGDITVKSTDAQVMVIQ